MCERKRNRPGYHYRRKELSLESSAVGLGDGRGYIYSFPGRHVEDGQGKSVVKRV